MYEHVVILSDHPIVQWWTAEVQRSPIIHEIHSSAAEMYQWRIAANEYVLRYSAMQWPRKINILLSDSSLQKACQQLGQSNYISCEILQLYCLRDSVALSFTGLSVSVPSRTIEWQHCLVCSRLYTSYKFASHWHWFLQAHWLAAKRNSIRMRLSSLLDIFARLPQLLFHRIFW